MNMNITIREGAALEDAKQIDEIVQKIQSSMAILDGAFKRNIPEGIDTRWSRELLSKWESYYKKDIPMAIEDMRLSASNLKMAVENVVGYSNNK